MLPKGVTTRDSCRSCGSSLSFILSLGDQYVSNFVSSSDSDSSLRVPLELVLCDAYSGGCGLLQLKHTTPPELLYKKYWYRSGVSDTMRNALQDITMKAERLVRLHAGDLVLDIGFNDGTLLRSYNTKNLRLVGFEPAENLVPDAQVGTTLIINDFFYADAYEQYYPSIRAKIITSIAMFYDLEDPNEFVRDIVRCLHNDGVWIVQMGYLPTMLEQNAFDGIYHEHLEYYSLTSLIHLLNRHDLRVFDAELNDVNGGSLRVYVKPRSSQAFEGLAGEARVQQLLDHERSLRLEKREPYDEFAERISGIKTRLSNFIKRETANGKRVYVYGASTKGNTLLQFCGLDHSLIRAAAERNPDKWGYKTVGTLIPIISEEQARAERPDYFLILPWHFLREFKEREREYLASGGKFLVPLPTPQIVISSRELDLNAG